MKTTKAEKKIVTMLILSIIGCAVTEWLRVSIGIREAVVCWAVTLAIFIWAVVMIVRAVVKTVRRGPVIISMGSYRQLRNE